MHRENMVFLKILCCSSTEMSIWGPLSIETCLKRTIYTYVFVVGIVVAVGVQTLICCTNVNETHTISYFRSEFMHTKKYGKHHSHLVSELFSFSNIQIPRFVQKLLDRYCSNFHKTCTLDQKQMDEICLGILKTNYPFEEKSQLFSKFLMYIFEKTRVWTLQGTESQDWGPSCILLHINEYFDLMTVEIGEGVRVAFEIKKFEIRCVAPHFIQTPLSLNPLPLVAKEVLVRKSTH